MFAPATACSRLLGFMGLYTVLAILFLFLVDARSKWTVDDAASAVTSGRREVACMMLLIWFWLVAIMITGYVVLDGFDLGVGSFISSCARNRGGTHHVMLRTIGPVWDGNEVWLLAGGGTLYFAFPLLYASGFSGFYLPLMMVLWLLILRGVGVELRMHLRLAGVGGLFDGCFGIGSVLLAIFYGAALGNVVRGVPAGRRRLLLPAAVDRLDSRPDPGILDWYTVLRVMALVALTVHGALRPAVKTEGGLQERARKFAARAGVCPDRAYRHQPARICRGSRGHAGELSRLSNCLCSSSAGDAWPLWDSLFLGKT